MGITSISLSIMAQAVDKLALTWDGMRMLELGNQYLYLDPVSNIPHLTPAKGYFEGKGVRHVSVDLNGKDGALALDLAKPRTLGELGGATFDVVTNFGTAEHVSDVYECLANMHNLSRPGALLVHAWPKHGNWPGHGFHYAERDTFERLAGLCGYAIQYVGVHPACGNTKDGFQVHCNLVKDLTGGPFPPREKFDELVHFFKD